MKCPICSARSSVSTTETNGRRYRKCGNNHAFVTQETVVVVSADKRAAKAARDAAIVADTRPAAQIAAAYGVAVSHVYSAKRAAR